MPLALAPIVLLAQVLLSGFGPKVAGQTPTPPPNPGGLPLAVWSNLPLLVCATFVLVSLVGLFFIVRLRLRLAREQADHDASVSHTT